MLYLHFLVLFQYAGLNIGPVHKKDVMRTSAMLEHNPEYVFTPVERERERVKRMEGGDSEKERVHRDNHYSKEKSKKQLSSHLSSESPYLKHAVKL